MLAVGLLGTTTQAINIYSAKAIINLVHYNFSYSKTIDFSPIIMGILTLIMNKILRIGTEMKEESDLIH